MKRLIFFLCFIGCVYAQQQDIQYKELNYEGVEHPRVEAYRQTYLTKGKDWLYKTLEEGQEYRIFIRNELENNNMPLILEYLPVVESEYTSDALSKSGAKGLWQFMLNSVNPFLVCNDYVDERLDPWKSTEAAISKLTDNYNVFQDWLLAITAYNCGVGALKRAIIKANSEDFWYLSENGFLSNESSSYVPKLLAVADVVENAKYYGVKLPDAKDWKGKTLDTRAGLFDYVTVNEGVRIKDLAYELRIDGELLQYLNQALIRGVTPPDSEYKIRLPEGMKPTAVYALNDMGVAVIN